MKTKRFICLLLAVAIIMLTGCGAKESEATPQENMDDQTLRNTIERIEYMGILAALDSDLLVSGYYYEPAYIGDADGDGSLELFYGDMRFLVFDRSPDEQLFYQWTQGGGFVIDANGLCYCTDTLGGPEYDNYDTEIGWFGESFFDNWTGYGFETAYTKSFIEYYDDTPSEINWTSGEYPGTHISNEQADALAFEDGTRAQTYLTYSFESRYRDHVTQSLQDSLAATYNNYSSAQMDINGDGIEETVISIPEIFNPWLRNVVDNNSFDGNTLEDIELNVGDIQSGHTAVIIISTEGETTTVSACAIPENVYEDAQYATLDSHCITLGGYSAYVPSTAIDFASISSEECRSILSAIDSNFIANGYYDVVFKLADVAEHPGDEILCFYQGYDGLYLDVISLSDGTINLIESDYMGNYSYYIVSHGGKPHILVYSQYISTGYNPTYSYYYSLYRYGTDNQRIIADSKDVDYYASQSDATSVSSFFSALNVYLEGELTIIHDTYALTGKEWMDQSDIDYGDRPTSSDNNVTEEGRLGFVKVYADTWLNLREGPGTQYDRVLLDPNNPQSFVKQAMGSPVTILEEIETGDPDNPVWVRIRIVYQDQVLEGYSSKRYIKVVGE